MPERRNLGRWQINQQAKVKLEGAEAFAECCINDVNFKGLKLSLSQRLTPDKFLKVQMMLSEDFILEIEAWVVWHRRVMETNVYGLYFSRIKDSDKEKIYQFVRQNFPQEINKQWWGGGESMATKAEFEDRRIFERFPVSVPMKFLDAHANKEGEAETKDISAKGIGFLTGEPLKAQTSLEMWLEVREDSEPFYARGEVVWSQPAGEDRYRVGVNLEKADLMGLASVMRSSKD